MLTIRQARPSDCDAMCGIDRSAILHHYAPTHGEQTASNWAASLTNDICDHWLASEMTIVAEESTSLLGFAQFDGDTGEIEICVAPEAEKRAIASALLAVIETEARTRGLDALRLSAMLNSERLYSPSGFTGSGAGEMRLGRDLMLPCVRMEKQLQYSEPRPERRRSLSRVGGG
jgi:ribosomal protein S18 acetylase RimI-like enzyme